MATKTTHKQWADGPYKLIPIPSKRIDSTHGAVTVASDMAHLHNVFIRGMNAVLLQGPHVLSHGQEGYTQQNVVDFLFFIEGWVKLLNHHHQLEETIMFAAFEEAAGEPGLFTGARHQHDAFHQGVEELGRLSNDFQSTPDKWTWPATQHIIDGFMPLLVDHLRNEIEDILRLQNCDSKAVRAAFDGSGDQAKKFLISNRYDLLPLFQSCCDKTYEGGNDFPPLPGFVTYLIKYWFAGRHQRVWRFSPCDFYCMPKSLEFLG